MLNEDDHAIQVFISHSWDDKRKADELARSLERYARIWIDWKRLELGDPIQDEVEKALRASQLVLVVWTASSAENSNVDWELRKARELEIPIVPCFYDHDENGRPVPPLSGVLGEGRYLGVDLHHHMAGVSKIARTIVELQRNKLPADNNMAGHPGLRLMNELRAYIDYISNQGPLRGADDQRGYMVERLLEEVERYVANGGNVAIVEALLQRAKASQVSDPEGIGMLVDRIERALGQVSPGEPAPQFPPPGSPAGLSWNRPAPPPQDDLHRRVAAIVPPGTADPWMERLRVYLDSAPAALQAMTGIAAAEGSPAGAWVTGFLGQYLANPQDLIPDRDGAYGRIDDSWLILNTAYRLIESGILTAADVPVDWRTVIEVDALALRLMAPPVQARLVEMMREMVGRILQEVQSYQPVFTPPGNGYYPVLPAPESLGGGHGEAIRDLIANMY